VRYSIRLAALLKCGEHLEQAARAERREIEEVQGVIRRLNGLWGMSGVISGLRKDVQDMEEQVQITLMMAQAARRIHQIYMDMERSITDAADCPFQLEPGRNGCGAPVFPAASGRGAGTGDAGRTGNAGNNVDVERQKDLHMLALLERYFRSQFSGPAAELAINQMRQQFWL